MKIQKIETIDQYIRFAPKETRAILQKIRETIKKAVPKSTEGISYRIPTVYLDGKYLIYFAAFKNHIGVYPIHLVTDKKLQKELKPFLHGKGSARFPLDKKIPYALISKIVKARAKDRLEKNNQKSR